MRVAWDVTPLSVPMTGIGRYVRDAILALAVAEPAWMIRLLCVAEQDGCDMAAAAFEGAPANVEFISAIHRPAVLTRRLATRIGRPTVEKWVGPVDAFVDSEWFRPAQQGGRRLTVVHDLIPHRFPEWVDPRTRRAHLRAMRTLPARADRIIVNSRATARDLQTFAGIPESRCTVAYPGVDPIFANAEPLRPTVVDRDPFVIAVGTTNRRKNIQLAIAALPDCPPEMHLVVVGASAEAESEIASLARARGVARRVHRLGYVTDAELAGHMAAAECLVFPSRFEGFGLPIVEAMSARVPVIASSDASLDEACGDAAVRVDPDNPRVLAHAISELDRATLVARGARHAAMFTRAATGAAVAEAVRAA